MTPASNGQSSIIRTERGLTIAGTRITLYDVMDYVTAEYPPKFIRSMLNLTDEQVNAALEQVLREENTPNSLPVITIGCVDRLLNERLFLTDSMIWCGLSVKPLLVSKLKSKSCSC